MNEMVKIYSFKVNTTYSMVTTLLGYKFCNCFDFVQFNVMICLFITTKLMFSGFIPFL